MSENSWRALVAALADDRAREVYAHIVLDRPVDAALEKLSPGTRRRVLDTLRTAGLISPVDGGWRAESQVLGESASAGGELSLRRVSERQTVDVPHRT